MIYQRQLDLNLQRHEEIYLVGAGGVGTWFAHFVTLAGLVDTLHVIDFDTIESHNLNRLPYPKEWVGRPKVEALKDHIGRLRGDVNVRIYKTKFDEFLITPPREYEYKPWIVVTVDNPDAHDQVRNFVKSHRTQYQYLKLACSYRSVTATTEITEWDGGDRTTGYEGIKIWAIPTALVALAGVNAIAHRQSVNLIDKVNNVLQLGT